MRRKNGRLYHIGIVHSSRFKPVFSLLFSVCLHSLLRCAKSIHHPNSLIRITSVEKSVPYLVRGGSRFGTNIPQEPITLGDLESGTYYNTGQSQGIFQGTGTIKDRPATNTFGGRKPRPLFLVISEFFHRLRDNSPTIYFGTLSSILIFILWQIPFFSSILHENFVCSRKNILQKRRYHTLLSSAFSHSSIMHLVLNMYAFINFGLPLNEILTSYSTAFSLLQFCVGAALAGNLLFLILTPHGSCIGLSGVTLAMLAMYAKRYPGNQIRFVIHFVPLQLPLQYALTTILIISIFGVLMSTAGSSMGDGVAHATHLGGLLFGMAYYEILTRRWLERYKFMAHRSWIKASKVK